MSADAGGPAPAPVDAAAPVPVQLRGRVRARDVGGPALLILAGDRLSIAGDALPRALPLPLDRLLGLRLDAGGRAPVLALHLAGGDVLEAEGDDRLPAFAALVERRATALPELTRALRTVGAARAGGGAHDRWFAPLLAARERAERATGWEEQLAAFAPDRLRAAWRAALGDLARERHPDSAPDRRALGAALDEAVEGADLCLGRLEAAAGALRAAGDAERLARWRAWVAELARLFDESDRCWPVALRELEAVPLPAPAPPPAAPGLWSRLRRRPERDA